MCIFNRLCFGQQTFHLKDNKAYDDVNVPYPITTCQRYITFWIWCIACNSLWSRWPTIFMWALNQQTFDTVCVDEDSFRVILALCNLIPLPSLKLFTYLISFLGCRASFGGCAVFLKPQSPCDLGFVTPPEFFLCNMITYLLIDGTTSTLVLLNRRRSWNMDE